MDSHDTTPKYQLIAFLASLGTLGSVFIAALIAASITPSLIGSLGAFGLGTITGGLLGILRLPSSVKKEV